jgi:hypothetical protein
MAKLGPNPNVIGFSLEKIEDLKLAQVFSAFLIAMNFCQ